MDKIIIVKLIEVNSRIYFKVIKSPEGCFETEGSCFTHRKMARLLKEGFTIMSSITHVYPEAHETLSYKAIDEALSRIEYGSSTVVVINKTPKET